MLHHIECKRNPLFMNQNNILSEKESEYKVYYPFSFLISLLFRIAFHNPFCLSLSLFQRLILCSVMETKKTWEKLPSLTPHPWPSHCLSTEISNLASPRRSGIIYNVCCRPCYLQTYGYNTPSMDASLRYLLVVQRLRSSGCRR